MSPLGNKILSFSVSSTDKDKRKAEEEAENAEVLFGKPLVIFGLLGNVRGGAICSLAPWALSFLSF
jgi:hypothetical protein